MQTILKNIYTVYVHSNIVTQLSTYFCFPFFEFQQLYFHKHKNPAYSRN